MVASARNPPPEEVAHFLPLEEVVDPACWSPWRCAKGWSLLLSLVAVVCLVVVVVYLAARVAEATYHRRRSAVVAAIDPPHVHRRVVEAAAACLSVPALLAFRPRKGEVASAVLPKALLAIQRR